MCMALCRIAPGGLVLALLLVGSAVPSRAACKKAITITETQPMNYATIAVTGGGGRVTISPSGAVTAPPGFSLAGAPVAGKFNVSGTNGCAVTISFTPGLLLGPGAAMTITNFTTNTGPTAILAPAGGQLSFSVGADLVVNASQAGGSYTGTYAVTVVY